MKPLTYTARKRFTMYLGLIEGIVALCILLAGTVCHGTLGLMQSGATFSSFMGISAGMTGAGFGIFFQARRLLHDPKRLQACEIRDMDERNQYIASQSANLAFWTSMVLTYIASFFSLFFSTALYMFLCIQLLVMLALYLIFARVIGRLFC